MERTKAPIADALEEYRRKRRASFHVPGHKGGTAYAHLGNGAAGALSSIGTYDVTELPGLDDLHSPQGAIAEAQMLAARSCGADRTYFLVGGSTVGNLAAIFAAVRPGELLLMQRDSHKSALHALMLREAGAVFVASGIQPDTQLPSPIRAEGVAAALDKYPEAKAVFITSPNYYGMAADVRSIAEAAHARGKPLIVDEAHGAHFGKHPRFPGSALAAGADAVVQSTHKMLSALTMGAMLHLKGDRIDPDRVEAYLRMLQSSSPSYPVMLSLDLARAEADKLGTALFEPALAAIDRWREELGRSAGGRFTSPPADDPFKLLLCDHFGRLSGFELLEALAERGIYAEMAEARHVVLAASSATRWTDLEALLEALEQISRSFPTEKKENGQNSSNIIEIGAPAVSEPVYFTQEDAISANSGNTAIVPLEESEGEISAEMIIPYPPGVPLLVPGERIARSALDTLLRLRESGAAVQGAKDASLRKIAVRRDRGRT